MDDSRLYSSIKEDASPFILGALADEVFDNHEDSPENNSSKTNDGSPVMQCKYKLKSIRVLSSSFIQRQEDKKKKELELQEQERLSKLESEKKRQRDLKEQDDLKGLRVHSWVLILPGKREIAEAIFLGNLGRFLL